LERGHPARIEREARKVADQSSDMLHEEMHINKIFPNSFFAAVPQHVRSGFAAGWSLVLELR